MPHIENFRVRFNEADATGAATVQTLGNWLQEAADQNARELGWAREQLQARHLFWALTGLRLVLSRYPRWRETAAVTTWPAGADRAIRRVASATSAMWMKERTEWPPPWRLSLRPSLMKRIVRGMMR